ncbi:MAG TPA: hypothetical protein VFP84_21650, partial [Kofleriaceae bacterium]|nr:hypothetical protein [Kofleriaceae bacterium]
MAARRRLTFPLVAVACALGPARPALASPRSDATIGRATFTGATMPSATSISLNPAALGLGAFDAVYVALTSTIDQLHLELSPFARSGLTAPGASVHDTEISPGGQLAFVFHLAGGVTLGFEARSNPRESFIEGHPETGYHTLGGGERDWLATIGASIKLTSDIFFGASLSHQNTFLRLKYDRDSALASPDPARGIGGDCGAGAPCTLEDPRATEIYNVNARSPFLSTANLRLNVGLVYQLVRDVWLGVDAGRELDLDHRQAAQ